MKKKHLAENINHKKNFEKKFCIEFIEQVTIWKSVGYLKIKTCSLDNCL